ncbi:MAG: adenylate/guanylate cyclase domain-containing protein [Prosthecobacter sp.]|jgi:adenylate cyclase|uniref:CHASE2 domain-containing protein n=1 Tax=Prosthecobacter sp. TaxID=1965333 RepID=UPI0019EB57B8|nr:adenylate/guanylate cyclase domain-containing protein [Prosthecobacter sp.]MBE2282664.1 adenylate/guanylate cyclase domain-containing protein [Prosthecobacter sp.]
MQKKKRGSLGFVIKLLPAVLLLALGLDHTRLGQELENLTLDWRFQVRARFDPPAHEKVLIVAIDEEALAAFGRWPWTREVHAQLMALLSQRPPAAAAFDLLFTEPSADPAIDQKFGDALVLLSSSITAAAAETLEHASKFTAEYAGNTKAITRIEGDVGRIIGNDTGLIPVPILAESSHTGFVNSPPGTDGVRRELPLVVRCGTRVFPSLVLQALLQSEGLDTDAVEVLLGRHIRVKGTDKTWEIPIDAEGRLTVNYRHPHSFTVFPYAGLVAKLAEFQGKEWPKEFPPVAGQILLIGQTATGLSDLGPTPHSPQTPLVLIHANALSSILKGDFITKPDPLLVIAVWIVLAFVTVLVLRHGSILVSILVPALMIVAYVGAAFFFFQKESLHLPVAWPVLGFVAVEGGALLRRLMIELRAKSRITGMFGTYVAPDVVKQMISSGEEPKLGGQQSEITAFFSDIAGFSSFSEKLSAEQLVNLMNDYLTEMTDILHDNGGTLDKFIGDAIVGMFGAPLYFEGHAHSACRAALLIQKRQIELRAKWRQAGGWPDIVYEMKTRIGLNSGEAIIGNMGSRRRFNYTMMGDTVNLAARSESGAKSYGVYTMITGETKTLAQQFKDDIVFRFLDRIVVKGRSKPVEMYELVGFANEVSAPTRECLTMYQNGMNLYFRQDWDGAKAWFLEALSRETHQDSNPSLVMLERCDVMKKHPPPADWDGVYVMKTK